MVRAGVRFASRCGCARRFGRIIACFAIATQRSNRLAAHHRNGLQIRTLVHSTRATISAVRTERANMPSAAADNRSK
eukprot:11032373-Lingulodinium_polyedra.AAC.1